MCRYYNNLRCPSFQLPWHIKSMFALPFLILLEEMEKTPRPQLPPYWQRERSVLWISPAPFDRGQHFCGLMSRCSGYRIPWSCQRECLYAWPLLDNPPTPSTALPSREAQVREAKRTAAGVCLVKLFLPHFSQPRWEGRFTDGYLYSACPRRFQGQVNGW